MSKSHTHGILGIDLGKTHLRFGVESDGRLEHRTVETTASQDPAAVLDQLTEVISSYVDRFSVRYAGIGAFGSIDSRRGVVLQSQSNPDWRRVNLRSSLIGRTGLRGVTVINDSAAAALGIATSRAGSDSSLACLMVATGVGLGVIRHGKPVGLKYPSFGAIGAIRSGGNNRSLSERCGGRGIVDHYRSLRPNSKAVSASDVFALAANNGKARVVFEDAVAGVVEALEWIAMCCDVERTYVSGGVWAGSREFRLSVSAALRDREEAVTGGRLRIFSAPNPWSGTVGAARYARILV